MGNISVKELERQILDYISPLKAEKSIDKENLIIPANSSWEREIVGKDEYSGIITTIRVHYSGTATAGVRIRWLYSPDNTYYDTPEDAEDQGNYEDITYANNVDRQRTVIIPILAEYVKKQVINPAGNCDVKLIRATSLYYR